MGDPRKSRGTYSKPRKRWDKARIEIENRLVRNYSLKNKSEIWKADNKVKYLTMRVKLLARDRSDDAEEKKTIFLDNVKAMGYVSEDAQLDQVLGLQTKNILDRRLQTIVYSKGLANSMRQARQFIVHNHIVVGDTVMNIPSYPVPLAEEEKIRFRLSSKLSSQDHPERAVKKELPKEVEPEKPAARIPVKKAPKKSVKAAKPAAEKKEAPKSKPKESKKETPKEKPAAKPKKEEASKPAEKPKDEPAEKSENKPVEKKDDKADEKAPKEEKA